MHHAAWKGREGRKGRLAQVRGGPQWPREDSGAAGVRAKEEKRGESDAWASPTLSALSEYAESGNFRPSSYLRYPTREGEKKRMRIIANFFLQFLEGCTCSSLQSRRKKRGREGMHGPTAFSFRIGKR